MQSRTIPKAHDKGAKTRLWEYNYPMFAEENKKTKLIVAVLALMIPVVVAGNYCLISVVSKAAGQGLNLGYDDSYLCKIGIIGAGSIILLIGFSALFFRFPRIREIPEKTMRLAGSALILIILAGTIYNMLILVWNVVSVSLSHNIFNETRDYVSFRLAHLIYEGKNPYSFGVLKDYTVPFANHYTPLMPALAAALCRISGFGILKSYYCINILLFLLTAVNIWIIVRKCFEEHRVTGFILVSLNTATFFSLFGMPIFNFHTDTIGIFLLSLIFLAVYINKENTLIPAILSVGLLFTKQILVVMILSLFLFYLIRDRKLALKYAVQGMVVGLISIGVIQILFPLYWTETIYAQLVANMEYGSLKDAVKNIVGLYFRYDMYCVLIIAGFILAIISHKDKEENRSDAAKGVPKIRSEFAAKGIPKDRSEFAAKGIPKSRSDSAAKGVFRELAKEDQILYMFLNVMIGTLFLFYFAKCGGDGYKYCQDLVAAPLFILLIYVWNFSRKKINNGDEYDKIKKLWINVLLAFATLFVLSNFRYALFSSGDAEEYARLRQDIGECPEPVFLGMNATQYLLDRDIWESEGYYFDDGHSEYFMAGEGTDGPVGKLFYYNEIKEAEQEYYSKVNGMIKDKAFSAVVYGGACVSRSLLEENYYVYDKYYIRNDSNTPQEVLLWKPKE